MIKNNKTKVHELTLWDNLGGGTQQSIDSLIYDVLYYQVELPDGTKGKFKDVYTGKNAPFYEYHLLSPAIIILNKNFKNSAVYKKYGQAVRERIKKHILIHFYESMNSIDSDTIRQQRKQHKEIYG